MTILAYIIEEFSAANLLPSDASGKARVRSISQYIVSEIQPFQNTRIDSYLAEEVTLCSLSAHSFVTAFLQVVASKFMACMQGINELKWKQYWIKAGLKDLEAMLTSPHTGLSCR